MSITNSGDGDDQTPVVEEEGSVASYKIFVGGLSWETDEDSLQEYFGQFGKVFDCVIMRDRHTGHPRGFGFVSYDDVTVANKVAAQKHVLDGRQVEAKHAVPRSDLSPGSTTHPSTGRTSSKKHAPELIPAAAADDSVRSATSTSTKKVFVGGLPSQCRSDELGEHFSLFGKVVDAQVLIDHKTGNSRGFGFVTFAEESSVESVMGTSQGSCRREIMGKMAEVKRAEPKQVLDARKSRDNIHGSIYGKSTANMVYNTGVGLMHITPLLTAQYANYYGGWTQYAMSQSPSSPMTYYVPGAPGMEFNPYVYDTLYGPHAPSYVQHVPHGLPDGMNGMYGASHRNLPGQNERYDPY